MKYCLFLFAVIAIASSGGCGDSKANVFGTVTIDGKPVEFGAIGFQASGKPKLSGRIREGGKYELEQGGSDRVLPGSYKVTVVGYERDMNPKPGSPPNHKVNTPKMYRSSATSGLTAEVKAGSNRHDFDLKSDAE